ncbi:hypothetical protein NQ318_003929 [Aromia moschata]|uniref:Uncharacterized protein n=1 Tax=Aromia moschata TaxID=1265417 RepID=A0AAV8Z7M7_9CUCU|nr:hypothetical protein NQ318_003929 [Aromia moschata]
MPYEVLSTLAKTTSLQSVAYISAARSRRKTSDPPFDSPIKDASILVRHGVFRVDGGPRLRRSTRSGAFPRPSLHGRLPLPKNHPVPWPSSRSRVSSSRSPDAAGITGVKPQPTLNSHRLRVPRLTFSLSMAFLIPVVIGTVLGLADGASVEYYKSKYDQIDVDAILNNRRMVNYYAACMLSRGPCPPEGMEFKRFGKCATTQGRHYTTP